MYFFLLSIFIYKYANGSFYMQNFYCYVLSSVNLFTAFGFSVLIKRVFL